MSGDPQTAGKLNFTLLSLVLLLNQYNIQNWFVGYGTLLGLVRNNSCIENDDDVDIMMDKKNAAVLKQILVRHGFSINTDQHHFLNTRETKSHTKIDFYLSDFGPNVNDTWSKIVWTNCFPLIQYNWNMGMVYLPRQYEQNLKNRYGEHWRIPQSSKIKVVKKYI